MKRITPEQEEELRRFALESEQIVDKMKIKNNFVYGNEVVARKAAQESSQTHPKPETFPAR